MYCSVLERKAACSEPYAARATVFFAATIRRCLNRSRRYPLTPIVRLCHISLLLGVDRKVMVKVLVAVC